MCDQNPNSVSYESWLANCLDFFDQLPKHEQEKTVSLLLNKCSVESKLKLRHDLTTFDFLSELPLEILEYILDNLPVVDALIACHVSPLWNERISTLDFYWRKKWMKLTNSKKKTLPQRENWKGECERIVGRLLKISEDDDLCDRPEEYYSPIEITAMDFCDDLLICFGSPVVIPQSEISDRKQIPTPMKGIACLYKATQEFWELVTTIEALPQETPVPVLCCHLTSAQVLAGRINGSLVMWNIEQVTSIYEISLVRTIQAHIGDVSSVSSDKHLNIAVSAGLDDNVKVWNLDDGSLLKSFSFNGVRGASLLTWDASPFVGYHCILIPIYDGVEYAAALICWGGIISLKYALRSLVLLDRSKDADCGFVLMHKIFVQGGSLVYAAGHDPAFCLCDDEEESEESTCTLIWKPITPSDFLAATIFNTTISDDEMKNFLGSLRPYRRELYLDLPSGTESLVAVGRCFSVVLINNPPNLTLVAHDGGATGKLLSARHEFGIFGEKFTMACTKWLDGTNFIKPDTICFSRSFFEGRIITWKWKDEVFVNTSPSLSDLLSIRDKGSVGGLPALSRTTQEGR